MIQNFVQKKSLIIKIGRFICGGAEHAVGHLLYSRFN